jgi:DNA-binding SARP family transcriptional activator/tetratricopeptide (TPR) repeat protein
LRVLGPLDAWRGGGLVRLGPVRQRAVLGLLALQPNAPVHREAIIDALWGTGPPPTAVGMIQSYVSRLRGVLDPGRLPQARDRLLACDGISYQLRADSKQLDLIAFRQLADRACGLRRSGDPGLACGVFAEALGLWRGEPLADLGLLAAHPALTGLARHRVTVIEEYAEAAAMAGTHDRVLPYLQALAEHDPLNERVHARLMIALAGSGQRAAALLVHDEVRRRLDEQRGVRPGAELTDAHVRVLRQEVPGVVVRAGQSAAVAASPRLPPDAADPVLAAGAAPISGRPGVPRQLPAPPRLFTGRAGELARLSAALDGRAESAGPVVISAIRGAGGIGKTWLALHWAHQHLDSFPGGQLWVNLRGFDPSGEPLAAAVAVRGFLDALGVDPAAIPADPQAQVGLYRSLVTGKRMLVVLDNAAETSQVTPLLPGSPGCTVLVTSRRQLTGLVTGHGARVLDLGVLPEGEARELLGRQLGTWRLAAEPGAVTDLLACCAGLPLAISVAAARAAAHPRFPLAALAAELRDAATRLEALDTGDPAASVQAVLSWSYHALDPQAATAFGLLGLAPGPDISLPAAASLTMVAAVRAQAVLRDLEAAFLVQQHEPGRYRMHDLVRLYAAGRASHELPRDARTAALRRVADFYLHSAYAADRRLAPHRPPIDLGQPAVGSTARQFPDAAAAVAWFDAEHPGLLAAQRLAVTRGWPAFTWQLAWTLNTFHLWRGDVRDWVATWQAGLTAAEQLAQPATQSLIRRLLGDACAFAGRYAEALDHLGHAIILAQRAGDVPSQGHGHRLLARAWELQGNYGQALEHANRALRLFQAAGDPVWAAAALNASGWYDAHLGHLGRARTACEAALALNRQHRCNEGEAAALDSLGYIALQARRYARAIGYYGLAAARYRDIGHSYGQADALACLAQAHAACGQHDDARHAWQQAHALYQAQHRTADAARIQQQLSALDQLPPG